ncbi:hypothetical protein D8674_039694 [Pyrus ussuriensis x Pyrus communis]|uniref:Uncharacterized protein n=1 Tax=Pyrus ussuriensis x Pyrus communis TaxID=2448454 RepID=A0A5N5GA77_9ROSA|nr:hypothetical protein D8674_039694 [Pyrus ussuriensis x Pyrus communis]
MTAQAKNESLKAYLKQFHAELVKIEKSNDRLATMVFKQGLYIHSPLSQKLKKKKYDYTILTKCFDIADDLIDSEINSERELDPDHDRRSNRRRDDQDTPPSPRRNDRRGCKDKQAPPKQNQYTTFLSSKGSNLFLTIWPRKSQMNTTPSTSALVTPPKLSHAQDQIDELLN